MQREDVNVWLQKEIMKRQQLDYRCFLILNSIKHYLDDELRKEAVQLCYERIDTADGIMKVISGDVSFMEEVGL